MFTRSNFAMGHLLYESEKGNARSQAVETFPTGRGLPLLLIATMASGGDPLPDTLSRSLRQKTILVLLSLSTNPLLCKTL
jgi:hypothetical protein